MPRYQLLSLSPPAFHLAGSSITGTVWSAASTNGVRAPGDTNLPGVTVQLLQGTTVMATTITDAAGQYAFSGITPGEYSLQFVSPSGMVFAPKDQGTNELLDSDADPATGRSAPVTLLPGQNLEGTGAGLYPGGPPPSHTPLLGAMPTTTAPWPCSTTFLPLSARSWACSLSFLICQLLPSF